LPVTLTNVHLKRVAHYINIIVGKTITIWNVLWLTIYYNYNIVYQRHLSGTFDHYFIKNLLLSLFWKIFLNRLITDKLMGKGDWLMVLCTQALCCWKMNMLEISHMAGRNCCNSNTPYWPWHRDRQVSNWCNVNHLWLADRCNQWLNVTCVAGALSRRLSCWLTHVRTVGHSVSFSVWPL